MILDFTDPRLPIGRLFDGDNKEIDRSTFSWADTEIGETRTKETPRQHHKRHQETNPDAPIHSTPMKMLTTVHPAPLRFAPARPFENRAVLMAQVEAHDFLVSLGWDWEAEYPKAPDPSTINQTPDPHGHEDPARTAGPQSLQHRESSK